jgi:hypothetical protein
VLIGILIGSTTQESEERPTSTKMRNSIEITPTRNDLGELNTLRVSDELPGCFIAIKIESIYRRESLTAHFLKIAR